MGWAEGCAPLLLLVASKPEKCPSCFEGGPDARWLGFSKEDGSPERLVWAEERSHVRMRNMRWLQFSLPPPLVAEKLCSIWESASKCCEGDSLRRTWWPADRMCVFVCIACKT
jgi:hypothetical protein